MGNNSSKKTTSPPLELYPAELIVFNTDTTFGRTLEDANLQACATRDPSRLANILQRIKVLRKKPSRKASESQKAAHRFFSEYYPGGRPQLYYDEDEFSQLRLLAYTLLTAGGIEGQAKIAGQPARCAKTRHRVIISLRPLYSDGNGKAHDNAMYVNIMTLCTDLLKTAADTQFVYPEFFQLFRRMFFVPNELKQTCLIFPVGELGRTPNPRKHSQSSTSSLHKQNSSQSAMITDPSLTLIFQALFDAMVAVGKEASATCRNIVLSLPDQQSGQRRHLFEIARGAGVEYIKPLAKANMNVVLTNADPLLCAASFQSIASTSPTTSNMTVVNPSSDYSLGGAFQSLPIHNLSERPPTTEELFAILTGFVADQSFDGSSAKIYTTQESGLKSLLGAQYTLKGLPKFSPAC